MLIRDCVHSGLCPFWIVSIGDCVHSGLCPFGIVSIRDGAIRDCAIGDGVHWGLCPFGMVSIGDRVFRDRVRDPFKNYFSLLLNKNLVGKNILSPLSGKLQLK